jgi:antitoxin VapB
MQKMISLCRKPYAMSINIKNKEADRLLAELKSATGKGASEVVLDLLRREHARIAADQPSRPDKAEVERILAVTREMQRLWRESPVIDPRTPDEILGYDENGLPS